MARRSQLEGRLLSILDAGQHRRPSRRTVLALGTVMTGVVLILTAVTPTIRAAAPVEAGVLTALTAMTAMTAMTTEVSLEGVATLAPTDRGVPAVGQIPAPVSSPTPAAEEAEVPEQAQRAAIEQAEATRLPSRLGSRTGRGS